MDNLNCVGNQNKMTFDVAARGIVLLIGWPKKSAIFGTTLSH